MRNLEDISLADLYYNATEKSIPHIQPSPLTKPEFVVNDNVYRAKLNQLFFENAQSKSWLAVFKPGINPEVLKNFTIYIHEVVACTKLQQYAKEDERAILGITLAELARLLLDPQNEKLKPLLKALSPYDDLLIEQGVPVNWSEIYGEDNLPRHLNQSATEEAESLLKKSN